MGSIDFALAFNASWSWGQAAAEAAAAEAAAEKALADKAARGEPNVLRGKLLFGLHRSMNSRSVPLNTLLI